MRALFHHQNPALPQVNNVPLGNEYRWGTTTGSGTVEKAPPHAAKQRMGLGSTSFSGLGDVRGLGVFALTMNHAVKHG